MNRIQTFRGCPLTTSDTGVPACSTCAAATVSAIHLPIRCDRRSRRRTISGYDPMLAVLRNGVPFTAATST
jgi:hypothetical protein